MRWRVSPIVLSTALPRQAIKSAGVLGQDFLFLPAREVAPPLDRSDLPAAPFEIHLVGKIGSEKQCVGPYGREDGGKRTLPGIEAEEDVVAAEVGAGFAFDAADVLRPLPD